MIGSVLNLERIDENGVVVATIPLYASKSWNKVYIKLREIYKSWRDDIATYGWDDIEISDYESQIFIHGDIDNDLGTVSSRYIIESIEIL